MGGGPSYLKKFKFLEKKCFRKQDKGNTWFIICDQGTTLCLQLDGNNKTPIILFYSVNTSDCLNCPLDTNLINVQWPTNVIADLKEKRKIYINC